MKRVAYDISSGSKLVSFMFYLGTETRRALDLLREVEHLTTIETETAVGVSREFRSVFNALRLGYISAANVSKILRPQSKSRNDTAAALMDLCDIPDDHYIFDRSVRNAFEHLDERLEKWLDDEANSYLHVELIEYEQVQRPTPVDRMAVFVFDVPSNMLKVLGVHYSISDLTTALEEILTYSQIGMSKITAAWEAGQQEI